MKLGDTLLLLLVAAIWGANFTVIRLGFEFAPPLFLSAMRFLFTVFSAIFFLPRPTIAVPHLIFIGLTLGLLMSACQFLGIHLGVGAGIASIVLQMQVIFSMLLARFFLQEKLTLRNLFTILFGVCGLLSITLSAWQSATLLGLSLVLAAAFWWAIANISIKKIQAKTIHPVALITWMSLIPILPLLFLSAQIEGPPTSFLPALLSLKGLASIAYLGIGVMIIGYGLWSKMLQKYRTQQVAPFSLLVPVFGLVFSASILHESLTPSQWSGSLLIMLALIIHLLPSYLTFKQSIVKRKPKHG